MAEPVSALRSFRSRLLGGESLVGTMLTLPLPTVAEILSEAGFDWLFVDGEHGPFETRELLAILQTVGDRTPCLVRVPAVDETPIKKALDLGAAGIIVPQVNTPEQAAEVVRYSRYAPAGSRGVGIARAQGYGLRFGGYVADANALVSVVVQAEHIRAVENIERIVQVEGVDAVLVGPYDLSASLGRMGEVDHPQVVDAIAHITEVCRSAGTPLGIFGTSAAAVQPYAAKGYTLLVAGVDTLILGLGARALRAEFGGGSSTA